MANKNFSFIVSILSNADIKGLFISYVGRSCIDLVVPSHAIPGVVEVVLSRGCSFHVSGFAPSGSFFCKITNK